MVACGSGDSEDGSGKIKDIDMTEVGIAYENDYEGPEYELTREVYGLVKSEVGGYKCRYYDHEYDILGIERPSHDSDEDYDSDVSYDSDEEGYWGADGYYNPSEKEKEENRREVEKWMKENW